jgi:cytochrome c biogenesis protein
MWLGGKTPYAGGGMIADVKPEHRLSERNPTFRGNLVVSEGTQSGTAILSQSDGILLQELPFAVELKKFIVEYYSTGMPKLFASEIVIHDRHRRGTRARGGEPPGQLQGHRDLPEQLRRRRLHVKLRACRWTGAQPFDVEGVIGGSSQLDQRQGQADAGVHRPAHHQRRELRRHGRRLHRCAQGRPAQAIEPRLGAADKTAPASCATSAPALATSCAMPRARRASSTTTCCPWTWAMACRCSCWACARAGRAFRYLRVPADDQGSMDGFMRLRAALHDPARARAPCSATWPGGRSHAPRAGRAAAQSATRALDLFAGAATTPAPAARPGGLQAMSTSWRPRARGARARGEVLLRILNGSCSSWRSWRARAAKPLEPASQTQAFMTQAVLALSTQFYPAPLVFSSRLQAGAGQRVPGGARPRQEHGLLGCAC